MVNETQKIMHKEMQIAATCVRVPVLRSHSESITVTFEDDVEVDVNEVREALTDFENVEVKLKIQLFQDYLGIKSLFYLDFFHYISIH